MSMTQSVTQEKVKTVTQVAYVGTSVPPPPPPPMPPEHVIAILEAQKLSDASVSRRSVVITITVILLYIIPEDWNVTFGGLVIDDFGLHTSFLMTLAMLWIMRSLPLEFLNECHRIELVVQCKVNLSPEVLAIVEVREEKEKYVPALKSRALRFISGASWSLGAITSMLLCLFVLGLVVTKVGEVFIDAATGAAQGETIALGVVIFMVLLILNIIGYLISAVIEISGKRAR